MKNYNPIGNSINGIISLPDVVIEGTLTVNGDIIGNVNETIENIISNTATIGSARITNLTTNNLWNNSDIYSKNYNFYGNSLTNGGFNISTDINNNLSFFRITGTVGTSSSNSQVASLSSTGNLTIVGNGFFPSAIIPSGTVGSLFSNISTITSLSNTNQTSINLLNTNLSSSNARITNLTSSSTFSVNSLITNLTSSNIRGTYSTIVNMVSDNAQITSLTALSNSDFNGDIYFYQNNPSIFGNGSIGPLTINPNFGSDNYVRILDRLNVSGNLDVTGSLTVPGNSNTIGNLFTTGGNIGIGTTLPSNPLEVSASQSNQSVIRIRENSANTATNGGGVLELYGTRSNGAVGTYARIKGGRSNNSINNAGYFSLEVSSADGITPVERLRVIENGFVGIGTTNPLSTLHVNNDLGNNYLIISGPPNVQQAIEFRDTATRWIVYKPGNGTDLRFYNGASDVITFSSGGNINCNNYVFNRINTGNTFAYVNTNWPVFGDKIYYTFNAYNNPATNTWVVPNSGYRSHAMVLGFSGIEFFHASANGLAPTTGSVVLTDSGLFPFPGRDLGNSTPNRWNNIFGTSLNINGNSNTIGSIITTGGNVGIGTSTPSTCLEVVGPEPASTLGTLLLSSNYSYGFPGGQNTGVSIVGRGQFASDVGKQLVAFGKIGMYKESTANYTDSYMSFFTNRDQDRINGSSSLLSEKMRITSQGFVGIGTTSPASLLQIDSPGISFQPITSRGNSVLDLTGPTSNSSPSTIVRMARGAPGGFAFGANSVEMKVYRGYTTASTSLSNTALTFYLNPSSNDYPQATDDVVTMWANKRVGIATSNPNFTLDVNGSFEANNSNGSLVLTTSGNVGIGTTTPDINVKLHIEGGAIQCASNDGDKIILTQFTNGNKISQLAGWGLGLYAGRHNSNEGFIAFHAGNQTERMRITNDGYVGINISGPTAPLNVNGKVIIGRNTTTNDTFLEIDRTSITGGTVFIQAVKTHNVEYGNLSLNPNYGSGTGYVGIGTTSPAYQLTVASDSAAKPSTNTWTISSDVRLKTNITQANLDTCYDNVKNIPLKRYTWLDSVYTEEQVPDRSKLGWIAQDVETILPKSVEIKNQHGIEDCRSLNADQIIACLYGAVQKLIQKVEQLENSN